MQAVVFERTGRPEKVLVVRDVTEPEPGAGQVLVRVAARPIQPADFLFVEGRYRLKPVFPQVAGFDGVGTIVACGPGVTGLVPGRRVAFRSPGAWAELAVAPMSRVYLVPPGMPDAAPSQFALNPLTAWGLLSECHLGRSSRVLITAGQSVVARILVKLALRRGLKVALLVREDHGYAVLDGRSGEAVCRRASVAGVLRKVAREGRFHAILDAVGGSNTPALIEALQPRGRLVSYGVLDDSDVTLRASSLLFRNIVWQGFEIDGWLDHAPAGRLAAAQKQLWAMLEEHPGLLPVIDTFPLSRVQEAIRVVRTARSPGKVLLTG